HVDTPPGEISVEHAGDEDGLAQGEAGIAAEIPGRSEPVGVDHDEGALWPLIRELVEAARLVPRGAVVRDHVARGAGAEDGAGDVAEARVADEAAPRIDDRDGDGGAACGPQRRVDLLEHDSRLRRPAGGERVERR